MPDHLPELRDALIMGDHIHTAQLTRALVEDGIAPALILSSALLPGMKVIGQRFRDGDLFLPDVLIRARAMKAAMSVLEPLLAQTKYSAKGKIVLGTVKGDAHDIGKNLVGVMLRGAGYEVIDLGTGCSDGKFLEAVRTHRPDVVGLSALLTTTMVYMRTVIETLRQEGETLPVIVGGALINARFADDIGATGTAQNAHDAVDLVATLVRS